MAKLDHAPNNFAGVRALPERLNDTTRTYPRTLAEAFPQWEALPIIEKTPIRAPDDHSVEDFWSAVIGAFCGGYLVAMFLLYKVSP